jgi:selenocysteine lyase/cysteine desulfurase
MENIYLNNAATSHPKPPEVVAAVCRVLEELPGSSERGFGEGEDRRGACRLAVADLLAVPDPLQVALLPSATHALNEVIRPLAVAGAHVVTTVLEHNSVLRPLAHARLRGAEVTHVEPEADGAVSPAAVASAIRDTTTLVAVTHASNVTGSIQPAGEIARVAADAGVPLLIDVSQSAGSVPVSYSGLPGRVFLVAAGHKGLLGPPGVGVLVLPDEELEQSVVGGTGIRSVLSEHPPELPLRHEAGTPNLPAIAGLTAGIGVLTLRGVLTEGCHRHELVRQLRSQLARVAGCHLLPLADEDGRAGIVALWMEGWDSSELAFVLHESFGIMTRAGLHCAPMVAEHYKVPPSGTVRLSVGRETAPSHLDTVCSAFEQLAESAQ